MIIEDEISIPGNGEIIPPESKAAELFVPNGLDKIIARVRQEVEQHQPDISTEKGRKAIASLARWVSNQKSTVEEYGKNMSMAIKRQATDIDAERKRGKEAFDALRDKARKPLTDYEDAVKVRVEAHEQALRDVAELSNVPFGATVADIEARIAKLDEFALRPWEEFAPRFSLANDAITMRLTGVLAETKKQDEERAAFKRSEEERIARESQEAKERVAKELAERDERVAREATERAERASKEREEQMQRDKEAAEARTRRAEDDAAIAKADAERDAQYAVEEERQRVADAKAKEEADANARERDKAHKAQINNAALAAFIENGLVSTSAKLAIKLIAEGKIPNVKVTY